ncbi:PLAC8 domain-containing protein [Trichoderma longibrachiatum]|uniref:PLAC8-domain-containing protein n=1 Tax=Trichoderma longibrachiatum ATCC 18648 TaxID=983965 RepID=A0A2T4BWV2_TRILO|nr:PLAC8-domain-containing protein [Trichoderma longibrachiatum ATCC 18648]
MSSQEETKGNESTWTQGLFDCCSPAGLCCLTCFLPCVTYGKAQHRMKHGSLDNYSCCNASCIVYALLAHCGLGCIPTTMQRGEIREKYSLEGRCFGDFCKSCWCNCCTLMQHEKELEQRQALLKGSAEPYQPIGGMVYSDQAQQSNPGYA